MLIPASKPVPQKLPRQAHARKSGPGRRHVDKYSTGKKRSNKRAADVPQPLIGGGFFNGQHTNAAANSSRTVKASIGARQYRKQRKALALAAREAA